MSRPVERCMRRDEPEKEAIRPVMFLPKPLERPIGKNVIHVSVVLLYRLDHSVAALRDHGVIVVRTGSLNAKIHVPFSLIEVLNMSLAEKRDLIGGVAQHVGNGRNIVGNDSAAVVNRAGCVRIKTCHDGSARWQTESIGHECIAESNALANNAVQMRRGDDPVSRRMEFIRPHSFAQEENKVGSACRWSGLAGGYSGRIAGDAQRAKRPGACLQEFSAAVFVVIVLVHRFLPMRNLFCKLNVHEPSKATQPSSSWSE